MSPFVVAYQQMFYYRQWPDPTVWLMAVTHALGAFVVGARSFWRSRTVHGAAVMPVIEAQQVSKRFLLGTTRRRS